MKKNAAVMLCILSLLALSVATVSAGDFGFVFETTESHPEYLWDVIPTYAELGVKYTGLEALPGNMTELILIGGGGFGHTEIWTDVDGMPLVIEPADYESDSLTDLRTYNSWHATWRLRFEQYLNPAVVIPRGDLAAFVEYAGYWMTPVENGDDSIGLTGIASAYPDRDGLLANSIIMGANWTDLDDDASPAGFVSEISVRLTPEFLGNQVIGQAAYTLANAQFTGYLPFFTQTQENGLNLISVYLANRTVVDAVFGNAVPQRIQEPISLGRKMRGFEYNTFGTRYTVVNNLELRLAGPEIYLKNLYPRVHLFVDAGYYAGEYLNTSFESSGFLASTGFEASVTLLNIVSVGYRGAVILAGENMEQAPYVGGLMFSLLFK